MSNALELSSKLTESGIAKDNAEKLLKDYGVPFEEAGKLMNKAQTIKVKDENDTETMALARSTRLELRGHRIAIEKKHDELKADSLAVGRAIDLVQRVALDEIKPIEANLEAEEKFAERLAAERRAKLFAERTSELRKYTNEPEMYNYADMADDAFQMLLKQVKTAYENELEAQKAIQRQNELAEIERKEKAEKDRKARIAAEKKLKAERDVRKEAEAKAAEAEAERAKLEKAQSDREAQEEANKKAIAEAEANAAAAPDKEKLLAYIAELTSIKVPELTTQKAQAALTRIVHHLMTSSQTYKKLIEEKL